MTNNRAMYTCECGHRFPLPDRKIGSTADYTCPKCGSTSEGHSIRNGGPGRIWFLDVDYDALQQPEKSNGYDPTDFETREKS